MKTVCVAVLALLAFGCTAPKIDQSYAVTMWHPYAQVLAFKFKDSMYPNVKFCALDLKDLAPTYQGMSITRAGSVVYAFSRLKGTVHPDTWAIVKPDETGNRWPHIYQFDLDGNGSADVYFHDLKRDGTCDLVETGKGKTA